MSISSCRIDHLRVLARAQGKPHNLHCLSVYLEKIFLYYLLSPHPTPKEIIFLLTGSCLFCTGF